MIAYASSSWTAGVGLVRAVVATVMWISSHPILLCLVGAVVWIAFESARTHLADKASRRRSAVRLIPSKTFQTNDEEIWRYATLLTRVAMSGPWWAPRRAKSARLRMTADGSNPLDFRVEGPAAARQLLITTPYRGVKVVHATPAPRVKKTKHTARAEFVVRGSPAAYLREVPLQPDPLQPLVDALATVRSDFGDHVEICLDIQRIPVWQLQLRRWTLLAEARQKAVRAAQQEQNASMRVEEGWRTALANLLSFGDEKQRTRLSVPPRPRPVDRGKVLGKLQDPAGLVRVQVLVRTASNQSGRAQQRLGQIAAALDVFAGTNRLIHTGQRLGPLRIGSDHWLFRKGFDKRWATAQIKGQSSWVRVTEIAGLLKPPTMHCELPVLPGQVPTYIPGSPEATELMVQGWYTGPDGRDRLIASRLSETLFSLRVGKSTYGKTEQALCQFVGLAHAGIAGMFIDPHGDAMRDAALYLAHPAIMDRLVFLDLTGRLGDRAPMGTWNPLSLERGQRPDEVMRAVIDAFAGTLGWSDASHPRALTLLTKAVELLVDVNIAAIKAEKPTRQTTLFQIRTLLTNAAWRNQVLRAADAKMAEWWRSVYPTIPPDAVSPVTNPLERLYANPVTRAFLGSPIGTFDFREAMDTGKLVWVCPSASGPTDRLLLSLMFADFFRAGLSRRDLPEDQRRPFHAFADELISIDGASSSILAQVSEELRKFGIRLHGMTQLLQRVSATTRESMMTNASVISSTAGSIEAVAIVAKEWGGSPDPAEIADLPRYHHYITLTVDGHRVGPLLIRGPQLSELYSDFAQPGKQRALRAAADKNLGARPQGELCKEVEKHDDVITEFLATLQRRRSTKVILEKSNDGTRTAGDQGDGPNDDELPTSQTDA
ncbi:ATP/GTP-binding protein [Streptomyces noursei]|uniref:ATP/GTP-binding protein n=1 Tax=Streptomyces noursei TaxID=1971 RepID=UPI0011AF56D7|nr:ATP/GTP-binding protein [Streptomyces noursei]